MRERSHTETQAGIRLREDFFLRDVLNVAPDLIGKYIVICKIGNICRYLITETEAYRGEEDKACHASRGRTPRTEVMYGKGGRIYVYFVYGMYWMLNSVTSNENDPQAVLIRGVEGISGPGRLTRELGIDRTYYGEDLSASARIWVEDAGIEPVIKVGPRVGIQYSGDEWITKPWRYQAKLK